MPTNPIIIIDLTGGDVHTVDSLLAAAVPSGSFLVSALNAQLGSADWQGGGSHTHAPGDVSGLSEAIDDRVAALLVAGDNITITYNDGAGTLTIDAADGAGAPAWGDITGTLSDQEDLQDALDAKLDSADVGAAIESALAALTDTVQWTSEPVSTPSGTTQTVDLNTGNHQTLSLVSASGDVTVTLTVPTGGCAAGTMIIRQHASTVRDLTWAVSAGSIKWLGTEPDWSADSVSSYRVLSWRWNGTVMFLAVTESGT